ncbi:MAG TPA: hypothetical protein VHD87_04645 [Acidimicrobiales bacterium]|nr:hypothetical protein [Acidimicrobiales bacterium]
MAWGRRLVVLVAIALVALAPPAQARPTGADVVAACRASVGSTPQVGERSCRTGEQLVRGPANRCRDLDLNGVCYTLDGRRTGQGHLSTYLGGWTHRALTLQRDIDDNVTLARATIPHTHNTFNSSVYSPTLTNQDPNQIYSIRDQLTMDVRAIEMDLHWFPSPYGKAKNFGQAVVLCHGTQVIGVDAGCSADRPFPDGLKELRQWLDEPQNADQVVLLYLENQLGSSKVAHATAAKEIRDGLGDLVARPPAGHRCAPLDTSTTPAQTRAAGHRVIIVGNCGPGAWGTWVHERGPSSNWDESSSGAGDDYPGLKTDCPAERARTGAGHAVVRWYEDSTWLSAMVGGSSSQLTTREAGAMARCGVTLIGFDQLTPEDPRLSAIVWSWAPNEPAANGAGPACAASSADARFHATDCAQPHAFACTLNPDTWRVTALEASQSNGPGACAREFPGSHYSLPANGWENALVRAAAGTRTVWLNYARVADGRWIPST